MAWESRIVGEGTEDPTQLLANPLNWRTHPYEQKEALKGALDEIGWIQRVIVNKTTGHVVDGHARIELALSNDQAEIPVLYVELTEEEEKLALATIDPIGAMATTDAAKLQELLADVETDSDALQAVLDDISGAETQILDGQTDEDAIPEAPEDPKSERGKIYDLGNHRLMCGDSTSAEDVGDLMAGQKADMVFTDPPYGMDFQSNFKKEKFRKIENDDKILNIAPIVWDAMTDNAAAYICTRWDVYPEWYVQFSEFNIKNCVVWIKGGGGLGDLKNSYSPNHEFIIVAHKGAAELNGKRERDSWDIGRDDVNSYDHPTQKPVALSAFAITNHSEKNVLDLFLGSGSTLIACEKLGRSCYGMELDPKYCDVIRKRWAEFVHGEGCDWEELTPETV